MFCKKETFKSLFAVIFSLAVLMPMGVKTVHLFGDHEHKACTDVSTHFHKKQLECGIQDFHFSSFHFSPQPSFHFESFELIKNGQTSYLWPEISSESRHYLLRGPPTTT